ncbi:hypothetical protein QOZ80_1BG0056510 [Eleusine coracana subsp. coracana]|nr:hypothetical protein QOZ80_1BG0056510 [Eleusine coracana subsp. coracana]
MCREPETATRCQAAMPWSASWTASPCLRVPAARLRRRDDPVRSEAGPRSDVPLPYLAGCDGYNYNGGGVPKRRQDHVEIDHLELRRTRVVPRCLPVPAQVAPGRDGPGDGLRRRGGGVPARLAAARAVRDPPKDGLLDEEEFKHMIEVVGDAVVLSLAGQAKGFERPTEEYRASVFLFVPGRHMILFFS